MKYLLCLLLLLPCVAAAQTAEDSTLAKMEKEMEPGAIVPSAFPAYSVVQVHTDYTLSKHELEFRVGHRFGTVGAGVGSGHNMWGLDQSSDIRIGFHYGVSDRLTIGAGRSKGNELIDGFLRWKVYRQRVKKHPMSITLQSGFGLTSLQNYELAPGIDLFGGFGDRLSFLNSVIITKKMGRLSLALEPTLLHRNRTFRSYYDADSSIVSEPNTTMALGIAARFRLNARFSLTADYMLPFSTFLQDYPVEHYYAPLGIGTEMELGGHVFQFNFTNSAWLMPYNSLYSSPTTWDAGGWRVGFHIVRVYPLKKKAAPVKFEWSDEGELTPE